MSEIIPLFYELIEDDFRPILHADRVLLPNEFAPEDKKLLCAAARSFTRNKAFIGNAVCLTPNQAKANARAHGFKGKFLKDRIRAAEAMALFIKYGGIMQQLLLDSEFGGKIPSDFRYYEYIEEKNINDEKPKTESFI